MRGEDRVLVVTDALKTIKEVINNNGAVGIIAGYYDDDLTILSVSDFLLFNLGYSFKQFEEFTQGSLRTLFFGENVSFLDKDRFTDIHGLGEGNMLTFDGTPLTVKIFKKDSVDSNGTLIWVMAIRVDWEHENITLINEVLKSGFRL